MAGHGDERAIANHAAFDYIIAVRDLPAWLLPARAFSHNTPNPDL